LEANKSDQSTTISKDNKSSMASNETPSPNKNNKTNPLLNYVELDTLGCGSFGRVVKVQKKSNGNQYAMKVIEKKKMEHVRLIIFSNVYLILRDNLI
jgi:serine/threonine protein kinase